MLQLAASTWRGFNYFQGCFKYLTDPKILAQLEREFWWVDPLGVETRISDLESTTARVVA